MLDWPAFSANSAPVQLLEPASSGGVRTSPTEAYQAEHKLRVLGIAQVAEAAGIVSLACGVTGVVAVTLWLVAPSTDDTSIEAWLIHEESRCRLRAGTLRSTGMTNETDT